MTSNGHMIVGIDVGTTKICTIVGEKTGDGISIVGIGMHPSSGLKKGMIIDVEATVDSIRKSVNKAESMADYTIVRLYRDIGEPYQEL